MKILNYTIALFLLIGITTSCKDDDDENTINVSKDDIVGTWNVDTYTIDGKLTIETNSISSSTTFDAEGKDSTGKLTFNEDNTVNGEGNIVITSSTLEGEETIEEEEVDFSQIQGTWSVEGNKLTIDIGGEMDDESQIFIIKNISSSSFNMEASESEEYTEKESGVKTSFQSTHKIELSK